ncbi:MAG: MFS transporter [Allosphingosinicella sp.]|uniref:MFS transporter n=1 Tax=Allosphingosinicella sp. TaxID=2823234 RepID=UPI00393924EE
MTVHPRPYLTLALVVTATLLGLMGTDLVLPAVPSLPETLGGDAAAAQLVLAAYVGGTSIGLLAFGALGDRFASRSLFVGSLALTGIVSFACAWAPSIGWLIVLRALQGAVASGPAVFAPAIARAMFDEARAVRAIGALGSIESLAPALAPILGVWLLALGGWQLSFELIGAIALALAAINLALPLIPQTSRRMAGRYALLLRDKVFLRYALSQAFVLGGLLVFVFGAAAVMVRSFGGTIADFIVMQVSGIVTFILCANFAGSLAARFGAERMIGIGTAMAAAGATGMLLYGLAGGTSTIAITALFVPINSGLGLRGPPGFYRAVVASHGDDARGSALVILFIMAATALGTAAAAPFIEQGLAPLAAAAFVLELAALACLVLLPRLPD